MKSNGRAGTGTRVFNTILSGIIYKQIVTHLSGRWPRSELPHGVEHEKVYSCQINSLICILIYIDATYKY